MAKSGQKPSQADSGGQRAKSSKEQRRNMEGSESSETEKGSGSGTDTPHAKPKTPSSGSSGAKKG